MHVASVDELRSLLEERGLERRCDDILARALPAVGFHATRHNPRGLGETRLGGWPDLPPRFDWPARDGRPLGFVAQMALRELAPWLDGAVPGGGLLSFFYDVQDQPWGHDPEDVGAWRVLHFTDDARLVRMAPPAGTDRVLPCRLELTPRVTLPPLEQMDDLGLSEAEEEAYWELDLNGGHQFLGHPCQIQGDMTAECCSLAGDDDWRLLLQVDSDDEAGTMWGDMGFIYYWIRERDLASADFSRIWLILQCH